MEDNGVWNHKSGAYAVNGDYWNYNAAEYYASDGHKRPVLKLSIQEGAVVQKVEIQTRCEMHISGWKSY